MNRRSFFKVITGMCAGVVAVFAPNRISASTVVSQKPDEMIYKKIDPLTYDGVAKEHIGTEFMIDFEMWQINRKLYPAVIIHKDGTIEKVPWRDLYKTD